MRKLEKMFVFALAMVMLVGAIVVGASEVKFTDVDEENEYLAKAVELLRQRNITKGTSETTFGTDELVTREQMAAFIYRLVKNSELPESGANTTAFTDLEDPTFFFAISWANAQGIIRGTTDTTFNPKGNITLQDAYTMVVRALGYDDGTIAYPFGYIDIAENIGLHEGLDELYTLMLRYTEPLTRGEVAIILYNTVNQMDSAEE